MIQYDLARARLAVQFLVNSSYFHHHIKKLRTTVEHLGVVAKEPKTEFGKALVSAVTPGANKSVDKRR